MPASSFARHTRATGAVTRSTSYAQTDRIAATASGRRPLRRDGAPFQSTAGVCSTDAACQQHGSGGPMHRHRQCSRRPAGQQQSCTHGLISSSSSCSSSGAHADSWAMLAPAGEFHSSDFDWHEHAAACAPLLHAQEQQAALTSAAGTSTPLPNADVIQLRGDDGSRTSSSETETSSDTVGAGCHTLEISSANRPQDSVVSSSPVVLNSLPSTRHHADPCISTATASNSNATSSNHTAAASTSSTSGPAHPDDAKWEAFYRQHPRARFFKQRRYLLLEFPLLQTARHVIELGCGCGSSLLPVLTANAHARATAFDVSATSVRQLLDAAAAAGIDAGRVDSFVADAADGRLAQGRLASVGADAALIMYTLSAVMPDRMVAMLRNAWASLAPGGVLMLRDHGLYDLVQLRIPPHQRLGPNLYRREDGTLAYFFTTEELSALAKAAGFEVLECSYICVISHNRKTGQKLRRVFVHGVFQRPKV